MRLVDTSVWVEWLIDGVLTDGLAGLMPEPDHCLVPTIVQLELSKWLSRERDQDAADQMLAYTQTCVVVALDTRIAVHAAALCRQHKLATADAVIYATALMHEADLLTCDAHFEGLPSVVFVPKT